MARHLEYFVVRILLMVLRLIPYSATIRLARSIAGIVYKFDLTPRSRVMANLRLVYGDALAPGEADRICREVFQTISSHVAEVAHITQRGVQKVRFENRELLRDAHALGKGVVVVSAHMGCFIHMVKIPHEFGLQGAVIMKKQRNEVLLDWGIRHLWHHFDLEVIPKKSARSRVVEVLQEGGVIGFFADQHPRKGGFPARFFGHDITAAGGPTVYAKRFGCPLLIFTAVTEPDGTHVLRFDGPISTAGTHEEISQLWLDRLEDRIRKYPGQWMWMHRRWRGAATPAAEAVPAGGVAVGEDL